MRKITSPADYAELPDLERTLSGYADGQRLVDSRTCSTAFEGHRRCRFVRGHKGECRPF